MNWHNMTTKEVIKALQTSEKEGLSEKIAHSRLQKYGQNILKSKKKNGFLKKFILQFNDFMIIILITAATISFAMSLISGDADFIDPIVILSIVFLNAILGTIQESKAEKAIEALKEMSSPKARVKRSGKIISVPAAEIVPGDILVFRPGTRIAADCRLISSISLQTDESSLTGESTPVNKNSDKIFEPCTPIADRENMLYSGTSIISGKGEGIVINTGMDTELGKIAGLILENNETVTPLQKKLSDIGKTLGILALSICVIIFFIGLFKHFPPFEMFMISVSLAVAAIPEGLPAIVTIMLAIGVQSMAKKNAIVRNLPAVETLGSASVICSDKTGTLTMNKMEVTDVFSDDKSLLFLYASLCCDTESDDSQNPTEKAIINQARNYKIEKSRIDRKYPRLSEIPFDSSRKLMSTAHKTDLGIITITKGAPDVLLKLCTNYYINGNITPLTKEYGNTILKKNSEMADKSLRVIAVAFKNTHSNVITENNLTFLGLIGLEDPPRPEVFSAVTSCCEAGIRPVMITGDHLNTATAIAKKIGIFKKGQKAITGSELDLIPQTELERTISDYSVFARVTPAHKVRIVEAWQKQGEIVAMTGDGVNDAPALKKADIGCSMGMCGTDVAKSASDIILTDDNFATIVTAIKKGREIYINLKKSIKFLLSSNIGEIVTVFIGLLFGLSSPLFPIQLLWINLVTDSLPAIALGLDPVNNDIMKEKPIKNTSVIFNKGMWCDIFLEGSLIGALAILAYSIGMFFFDISIGRTMAFSVLSISQLVHAFNMKSETSILNKSFFNNKFLVFALLLGITLQITIVSTPLIATIFKVTPLSSLQWLISSALAILPIPIVELQKKIYENR